MKNFISVLLILIIPICVYLIMNKNSENYSADAKENLPTMMTFTSSMCMDCKKMKEVINEIENDYTDKINILTINALDKDKKIKEKIKKHGIVLVPTTIFLDVNGNETGKIEGFIPKEDLIIEIEEIINE